MKNKLLFLAMGIAQVYLFEGQTPREVLTVVRLVK
jgi:hypothetical protein